MNKAQRVLSVSPLLCGGLVLSQLSQDGTIFSRVLFPVWFCMAMRDILCEIQKVEVKKSYFLCSESCCSSAACLWVCQVCSSLGVSESWARYVCSSIVMGASSSNSSPTAQRLGVVKERSGIQFVFLGLSLSSCIAARTCSPLHPAFLLVCWSEKTYSNFRLNTRFGINNLHRLLYQLPHSCKVYPLK